jgi:hypothetical protein
MRNDTSETLFEGEGNLDRNRSCLQRNGARSLCCILGFESGEAGPPPKNCGRPGPLSPRVNIKRVYVNGVERTGLKAHRDDKVRQLNDLITRFRSTVRGVYGPDSALYQQAGGTRLSARKSPARSTDVEPAGNTTSTAAPSATATHA